MMKDEHEGVCFWKRVFLKREKYEGSALVGVVWGKIQNGSVLENMGVLIATTSNG